MAAAARSSAILSTMSSHRPLRILVKLNDEIFFGMIILVQERSKIINDFTEKLIVWLLSLSKQVTFRFEDAQERFHLAVVTTKPVNYRIHV